MLQQTYEIIIKDNNLAIVEKIDYDKYIYFESIFNYVYHTKKGGAYPLHKNLDAGIDLLIVDNDKHLDELLNDLTDQGFCESIEFAFIEDYFRGNYKQYCQAF